VGQWLPLSEWNTRPGEDALRAENAKLQAALQVAANEAFGERVVDTEMAEYIGPGKEYADKQDWLDSLIAEWRVLGGDIDQAADTAP
jgi:hypothetical protein